MSFCINKNDKINSRGFTLVELMITIAIMAILAAIVVPNFSLQIIRSKLTDTADQLAQLRLAMERQFQNTGTYLNGGACGITMPAANNFTFTCAATSNTYTLTASNAAGKGLGDADSYKYTINQVGAMQTLAYAGTDYPADSTDSDAKNCWLIQQNEC
jgi:type IV pilus assembly protein PilE